jgi:hypothetical protein
MVVPFAERRRMAQENGSQGRQSPEEEPRYDPSRNGLKDGLFGRVHHLDDESPDAVAALRARYWAENRPRDALEEFWVDECFIGHLQRDRYCRALTSEIRCQQRLNRERWEEARRETAGTLRQHLMAPETVDLQPIVTELRGFGHGLEVLAQDWLQLRQALAQRGFLTPAETHLGVRLMGVRPAPESVARHQDAFLFTLWSAGCFPVSPVGMIDDLLQPANRPAGLEDLGRGELLPGPAECREQLTRWVHDVLAELSARADQVAREVDGPELARVLNPAAIVLDPDSVKRFDRARNNYQSTYYKAWNALEAHRKRDAARHPNPPREGADPDDRRDHKEHDEDASARPGPAADIKPPAPDGASAAGPSRTPDAVTEIPSETPDGASEASPRADLQNGREIGPNRAATDQPGACRSYHEQVAKRPVGAIVTVRSPAASPRQPGRRKE